MVKVAVSLTGNSSMGCGSNSIQEFSIMKSFSIDCHAPKAPSIIQVDWLKSPCGWVKCNSDSASRGNPGEASCGALFRDSSGAILGCMAEYIGIETSFHAEIVAAMRSIEIAYQRGWHSLWLECDSLLVVHSFKDLGLVPWKYKNRWWNYINLTKKMLFHVSHIYREGNPCADKLASYGIHSHKFS